MTNLRPYQIEALNSIRDHYKDDTKKVLLYLSTGGGKTVVFCEILKGVIAKGKKAIMVTKGVALIEQCSRRLFREKVEHGCLQANHWNKNPNAAIQVCSVDTLHRRKIAPPADLIIIDEAHYAGSESFKWLISQYPDAYFLPVSATPHNVKGGLRHVADVVVQPITTKELMKQGYLSKPTYYVPSKPDLSSVKIDKKTGDYDQGQLGQQMIDQPTLFGDMIKFYRLHADGEPSVVFASTIEHSKILVSKLLAEGIQAEHIEADTSPKDREETLKRLESGETKIVSNVGILTTGVDIPYLKCVILMRPTKSYNLYIQMIGRGTRVTDTKTSFVVLDHANNLQEHGPIEADRPCDLDGEKKREGTEKPTICKQCFGAFFRSECGSTCPYCGAEPPASELQKRNVVVDTNYDMAAFNFDFDDPDFKFDMDVAKLRSKCAKKGYKPKWVYYELKKLHGEEKASEYWQRNRAQ